MPLQKPYRHFRKSNTFMSQIVLTIKGDVSKFYLLESLKRHKILFHVIGDEIFISVDGVGSHYLLCNLIRELKFDSFATASIPCFYCERDMSVFGMNKFDGNRYCDSCFEFWFDGEETTLYSKLILRNRKKTPS